MCTVLIVSADVVAGAIWRNGLPLLSIPHLRLAIRSRRVFFTLGIATDGIRAV